MKASLWVLFLRIGTALSLPTTPHPLEDAQSWRLHQRRSLQEGDPDDSETDQADEDEEEDMNAPYTIIHKKLKEHIPFAGGDTTHGIMIDAGSQGTRLHIYEWDKRFLLDEEDLLDVAHGKKLSIPTSNARWTDKYTPGMDVFAYHKHPKKLEKALRKYLGPLIDFAKHILKEKQSEWHTYPIYLKATGGLRTLPKHERVRLIDAVRILFQDHDTFNPFQFDENERVRVISGEEEAIYGWVGVNFALGTLISDSQGHGVAKNPQLTYGMLEMGGASTQIAVFENHGDLMANLFKLQLGGARHWNVYVHSYLYFGINGAWTRLNAYLHWKNQTVNPCLPVGSSVAFDSWVTVDPYGHYYPRSANESLPYNITMISSNSVDYKSCSQLTHALLRKETNEEWCEFEMDGSCGFAGIYQPPLPKINKDIDEFVATSNFVEVFSFLRLGNRANVSEIGEAAETACGMSWDELKAYNAKVKLGYDDNTLAQMCFRSVFVYELLRNGWGFGDEYRMMAADVINGQKMGWALGCMLYEINTLPWDFHPELLYHGPSWWLISLYIVVGTVGGSAIGFILAMRTSKRFNKTIRETKIFHDSGIWQSESIRNSLAIPPDYEDDFRKFYEEALKNLEEEDALLDNNSDAGGKYT